MGVAGCGGVRYVTSDCGAIAGLVEFHNYSASKEQALADALTAGVDLDCGATAEGWGEQAVAQGRVSPAALDAALMHLLTVRMRLGMYDGDGMFGVEGEEAADHAALALEAALQGVVLLKNEGGTLPLREGRRWSIAVIGPLGNATGELLGSYAGEDTGAVNAIRPQADAGSHSAAAGLPCSVSAPLAALTARAKTIYRPGCADVACQSDSLIEPAVAAARSADVTVLLLGLNLGEENEGADRRSLELPGLQSLLLRRVARASARPVILVLLCGGPVDVSEAAGWARVGAVIWMGYPGQAGGEALARVLFGDFNPSETKPEMVSHQSIPSHLLF